jgi:hypothetical protein
MRDDELRTDVVAALRARMPELEQATFSRLHPLSGPLSSADQNYAHGLREAVRAGVSYAIEALQRNGRGPPPIPTVLLVQTRLAARTGVSLDTVLRLYVAGHTLLVDFVAEEAASTRRSHGLGLRRLQSAQADLLDRLLVAIAEEYSRERQGRLAGSEERRADRVTRLLNGELVDTAELSYEFAGHHLGLVAAGPAGTAAIRAFAEPLDRRLLLIRPDRDTTWAWLGGRSEFDQAALRSLRLETPRDASLALGEPATGFSGWRLTHRQAIAALPVARAESGPVHYADVALLVALGQNELLTESLRELYLAPLRRGRGGGEVLRRTLSAYFQASRNVTSAASLLGVSRQTVGNRLRAIETRLDRSLSSCSTELEIAIRLEAMERSDLSV